MQISPSVLCALQRLLGRENVQTGPLALALNGYDCSPSSHRPDAVLHLTQLCQLEAVIGLMAREKIPFIVRAAGTNHAGSCAAVKGGVIVEINALRNLLNIDTAHGWAEAEPALVTGRLQRALQPLGFFYAPDPASQHVSTLGGNLAQNASGARCLKYGNTADNTLQIEFITPDAQTHVLRHDDPGPDFLGLVAGSEGTLGVIKRMRVKILPAAKHLKTFLVTFNSLADSVQAVSELIARGLIPRCIEAMDRVTIQAVENFAHAGYPDAEALLIIELDGSAAHIKQGEQLLQTVCQKNQCLSCKAARTAAEREKLWSGRRAAYSAMAALAPNVAVGDGTVPRSQLPNALKRVREIIDQYGVKASLLFHAGDGNFHPQIVYDARNPAQIRNVQKALQEILKTCVDCGGTISGEHGIGIQKRALMAYQYSRQTLRLFAQIKHAFDPYQLANPEKIIPVDFEEKANSYQEQDPAVLALQQEILRRASQQQPTVISGRGTRLAAREEHLLYTKTLNRILDIDTANYTATVQAGATVADITAALQKQHLFAYLPANYSGTLGGLVATKAAPWFTGQIIGVQAVLPNGDIVQYGGKIMKNAAGYNLCRLFCGSWGALGLITQITFKIYTTPLPKKSIPAVSCTKANALFQAVKKEIDPGFLFHSPAFDKESV